MVSRNSFAVIATARLLIQLNRHQVSARRGVILSGASGTGKTTALTQLGRAHELATRKRHPHDGARLPAIYVTVPPAATPKMLATEFARFFGLPFLQLDRPARYRPPRCRPRPAARSHRRPAPPSPPRATLRLGSRLRRGADRLHDLGRLPGEDLHVWHTWDSRTYALIPYDHAAKSYSSYSTSKLFAAVYPEVIGLAPLIASPHWRQLACGTTTEQSRFFAEVGKRVTYPYSKKEHGDAVAHWAIADAWRPPSAPLTTYTPGQVRGKLSPLHASRAARHANSVKWYSRINRNQGRTLLFHNHLKPVLLREKTPQYVKWEGTVWHSSRTDDLMKEEVARRRKELQAGAARLRSQRAENARSNWVNPADADPPVPSPSS